MKGTHHPVIEKGHADKPGDGIVLKLRQIRNQLAHKSNSDNCILCKYESMSF